MWQGLPPFLRSEITFRHMLIQCPSTGSYIRGRAATPKGGRGPAYKRGLMDEAAHMERGAQLYHGLRASVKFGLILNSSPLGKGNIFATIRFQDRTTFRRLSFGWWRHPEHAVGLYCACGWHCPEVESLEQVKARAREPWFDWLDHDCVPGVGRASARRSGARCGRRGTTRDRRLHARADRQRIRHQLREVAARPRLRHVRQRAPDVRLPGPARAAAGGRDVEGVSRTVSAVGVEEGSRHGGRHGLRRVDAGVVVLGQVVDDETMEIDWLDEEEHSGWGWSALHTFLATFWMRVVREATGFDVVFYGDPAGKARYAGPDVVDFESEYGDAARAGDYVARCGQRLGVARFHSRVATPRPAVCVAVVRAHDRLFRPVHFPLDSDGNPLDRRSHSRAAAVGPQDGCDAVCLQVSVSRPA